MRGSLKHGFPGQEACIGSMGVVPPTVLMIKREAVFRLGVVTRSREEID